MVGTLIFAFIVYALVKMAIKHARAVAAAEAVHGRIMGRVGRKVILYADPPRLAVAGPKKTLRLHNISSETVLAVESSGGISVSSTRGRNLGSKAAAGVLTGGVGLLFVGNAKTRTTKIDSRELYLSIDCPPSLPVVLKLVPNQGHEARKFALLV
jgi:hypothetical protein